MRQLAAIAVAAVAGLAPAVPAVSGGAAHVYGEAGGAYTVPLRTIKELRLARAFRTTMRQQHDFSCGSAAIATLLTYHYDRPVTEAQVFQAMYAQGDRAKIQRHGFSLLDMKRYLESRGYQADGFEVTLDKLAEARVPAIALVREHGYNHFVVIKGLRDDRILVGDPSSGTREMTRAEFERIWHGGILLVIRSHTRIARFDVPDHWRVHLASPLSAEGMNRNGLASPTLMMRGPNDF